MEIIRAKNSGFCFGVKAALEKTLAEVDRKQREGTPGRLCTCGPLIHNKTVTDDLAARGVEIIEDPSELKDGDTLIIRSHGEPKSFYDAIKGKDIRVVDATCPFVAKIHDIVSEAYKAGKDIIIVGDRGHAEVIATNGWCENKAVIVNSPEDAEDIPASGDYLLVCQTTIRRDLLDDICEVLKKRGIKAEVHNTICGATRLRQEGCAELAKNVDAMVVIGGKNSSNSAKLFEIAKKYCRNSFFGENIDNFSLKVLRNYNRIGIAAGASTPESVIKEVIARMSDTNNEKTTMADFMDEIDASLKLPKVGDIVDGTVLEVTDKQVVVNLGCKKDGVLPLEEVTLEEGEKLEDAFKPGDEIQAKVVRTDDSDGNILLSKKKFEISKYWNEINEAHENKTAITVKVERAVNGGVIASYKELTGFIPMSQLSDRYVENADEFIGQTFDVKVTRLDPKRNRAVFSHKAVLREEKQKQVDAIWENLHVGDIVEGTVMRFTEYGAFVDIGGIDGLLHISEISWGKLKHPREVLSIGQKINVKVLSMNQEKGKISLGLKQTTPEPWSVINEKYSVGQIVTGKVVQLKEYGAFVEIEPGLDGLVHISEVAHKRVADINDELSVGEIVKTKILDIDTERKRISLSIKAAADEIGEEAARPMKAELEAKKAEAAAEEEPKAEEPAETPEETPAEEPAPAEKPTPETPAAEAAPAPEAPAEETVPVEETPVEEAAPAEEAPAEEAAPAEESEEKAE